MTPWAAITTQDRFAGALTPAGWQSGHPALDAPYYEEFRPLLRPEGGVAGFRMEFPYTIYYHAVPCPPQQASLAGLIRHAQGHGLVPVLGCCRTAGRLPWLRQYLPGYHVFALRDPHDQWLSFRTQAERHHNSYFHSATYLTAAAGAYCSDYAWFFDGLPLPPRSAIGDRRLAEVLCETLGGIDDAQRCRIFLRVWMLDTLIALPHADIVVDMNRLSTNADDRGRFTTTLRDATGLADLSLDDCASPRADAPGSMWRYLVEEALAFLDTVLPRFRDAPAAQVVDYLTGRLQQAVAV